MTTVLTLLFTAISLTVTPLPGKSHITKSGQGSSLNNFAQINASSRAQSKTITRSLKWRAELRIRENRPEKLELKAFYIGQDARGKLIQLGTATKPITLDKNGRAQLELETPKTTLTRSRTTTQNIGCHGRAAGFSTLKSTTRGERAMGCVIQIWADGKLEKSWSSDSRWAKEAKNEKFSVSELEKNKSKIGV